MHHLEGRPSSATNPDSASRRRIGRTAGRLSLALAGVEHSVASRRVPWDLRGFEDLAPALESVLDARARAAVETALEVHAALLHETRQLPAQLSHNDLNGGNVLVSPHDPGSVSGIIDFGDAAYAPRVFDIGIAAAYAAAEAAAAGAGSPWSAAASFTLGYADAVPIDGDELALVPALARARLAQRVLIAAGRRVASPAPPTRDNDAWLATPQRDLLAIVATSPSDADDAPKEWR
jgi:Ser/Thr protein kinase RdoA (MazF antagonist)